MGESIVDRNIEKLELKTPKNHHEKIYTMGDLPHLLSSLNSKETKNYLHFQKRNGDKNTHSYILCTTKYITYIYTYKTSLDQIVK